MSATGSTPVDHTGRKFNRWTAIDRAPKRGVRTAWNCVCNCGTARAVLTSHLVSGATKSCGCHKAEVAGAGLRTHGASETAEYGIWCRIISRCGNANLPDFHCYGGRGITVCDRWRHSFESFLADMGPRPSRIHSVDRIDVNGNYEPGNCRWATPKEQGRNTRRNRIVTYQGREMTLVEAAELSGVNYGTAKWRLCHGRTDEEAFTP